MRANERQTFIDRLEPKNPPPNSKYMPQSRVVPSAVPGQSNVAPPAMKHSQIVNENVGAPTVTSKAIPEDSKAFGDVQYSRAMPEVQTSELIGEQRKVGDFPDVPRDLPQDPSASKAFANAKPSQVFPAQSQPVPGASRVAPGVSQVAPGVSQVAPPAAQSRIAPQPSFVAPAVVAVNTATQPPSAIPQPSQIPQPVQGSNIAAQTSFALQPHEDTGTQTAQSRLQSTVHPPVAAPSVSKVMPSNVMPQPLGQSKVMPGATMPVVGSVMQEPGAVPQSALVSNVHPSVPPHVSKVVPTAPVQASRVINEEMKSQAMNPMSTPLFPDAEMDPSSKILLGYKDAVSCAYFIPFLDNRQSNVPGEAST